MNRNNFAADSHRSPDCAALAPLLALRATGVLDATETARVERHLATCATCQADAALDDALDARLRSALLAPVGAAPALALDDILRATRRSDGNSATLADSAIPPAPTTGLAPPRRPGRGGHHWRGGLTAIAVALAIVLFAVYVFGSLPRIGGAAQVMPTQAPSALLAQQTVYLPTSSGVYALRASDGAIRWTYPTGIDRTPIANARPVAGVALDHSTLYVLAGSPDPASRNDMLLALNASDGAVHWSVQIPGLGVGSLLQVGGLLIVAPLGIPPLGAPASEHAIAAFSAANGAQVWRRPLDEPPVSSPVAAGGVVFIGTTGHLVALSAASGAQRWSTPIIPSARQQGTTYTDANTSVALAAVGDSVYVLAKRMISQGGAGAWEDNFYAITAADGTHRWLIIGENDSWATAFAPAVASGVAYIPFFGGLAAFPRNGDFIWRFIPNGAGNRGMNMTGAAIADGVVYTTDLTGILTGANGATRWENFTYAVRATNGAELWRAPTNGGLNAVSPVVASGVVFTASTGVVRALRASDGHQLWMYLPPGASPLTAPVIG